MTIRTLFFSSLFLSAAITLPAQEAILNTNAERDIQLVKDYLTALVAADAAKVNSLAAEKLKVFGPAWGDSLSRAEMSELWTAIAKERTGQDLGFGPNLSVIVPSGELAGAWVLLWGTYQATDTASKAKMTVPYQVTALVKDNRIQTIYQYYDNLAPAEAVGMELKPKQ